MNKKNMICDMSHDTYNSEDQINCFRPSELDHPIDTSTLFCDVTEKNVIPNSSEDEKKTVVPKEKKERISMHMIATKMMNILSLLLFNGLIFVYQSGIYIRLTVEMIIEFAQKNLKQEGLYAVNFRVFEDVLRYLKGLQITKLDYEPREPIFAWNNDLRYLDSGIQLSHTPDIPIFSKVNINRYPGMNQISKRFMHVLKRMSGGDSEIIRRILEFMGYCLLSDPVGKYFFVLGTARESGKSKIIAALLERLIGSSFISSTAIDDLGGNFGLSSIIAKRLNLSMDLPAGTLNPKSVSRIKMLTGSELIEINEKYMPKIPYHNTATFVFGTNYPVTIKGEDDAFWDRLILVPFLHSVPKELQNDYLIDELWEEREAIVSMALSAVSNVTQKNITFSPCAAADEIIETWRDGMTDNVIRYIKNRCIFDESARTHSAVLYQYYIDWCFDHAEIPKSENYFSRILVSKFRLTGFRWKNDNGELLRGFKGIRLCG